MRASFVALSGVLAATCAWADAPAAPTELYSAACIAVRDNAAREADALITSGLGARAARESSRQLELLRSIQPTLAVPGRDGKSLQAVLTELGPRLDELESHGGTQRDYYAAGRSGYARVNEVLGRFVRRYSDAACPAGSSRRWVTAPRDSQLRNDGYGCIQSGSYERAEPLMERTLWAGGENGLADHELFAEYAEDLSHLFRRDFQLPIRIETRTLMKLRTGQIGEFYASGTADPNWAPSAVLRISKYYSVWIAQGQLETDGGRAKFREEYVKESLGAKECYPQAPAAPSAEKTAADVTDSGKSDLPSPYADSTEESRRTQARPAQ